MICYETTLLVPLSYCVSLLYNPYTMRMFSPLTLEDMCWFHHTSHRNRVLRKVGSACIGKGVRGQDSSILGFAPHDDGEICLGSLGIVMSPKRLLIPTSVGDRC
jgi:hypothetical protein